MRTWRHSLVIGSELQTGHFAPTGCFRRKSEYLFRKARCTISNEHWGQNSTHYDFDTAWFYRPSQSFCHQEVSLFPKNLRVRLVLLPSLPGVFIFDRSWSRRCKVQTIFHSGPYSALPQRQPFVIWRRSLLARKLIICPDGLAPVAKTSSEVRIRKSNSTKGTNSLPHSQLYWTALLRVQVEPCDN